MFKKYFYLMVMLFVMSPYVNSAQLSYVNGVVLDGNNNPLRGAEVRIGKQVYVTRNDGVFFFDQVAPNQQVITVKFNNKTRNLPVELASEQYLHKIVYFIDATKRIKYKNQLLGDNVLIPNVGINSYGTPNPSNSVIAVEVLSRNTNGYDLWLIDKLGNQLTELVASEGDEQNPRWSPDGKQIVYHKLSKAKGYQIWLVDVETKVVRYIDDGLTPTWSPDGKYLAYGKKSDGNWDIYKHDLRSSQTIRLTNHSAKEQYPYWALVNGKEKLLFASKRTGTYEIWEMNTDGSNKKRLTVVGDQTGNRMIGPVVSPNGKKIAFWEIDYMNDHSVWLMNHDGSDPIEFIKKAANPEWGSNANGEQILYFDSKITGRAQIWYANVQ